VPGHRPLITLDLDGVLCRPPFGINPGSGRHRRRDAPGKPNLLWLTERWRYFGRQPMPGAREGLAALRESFDCHIVTARATVAEPHTRRWLARNFGDPPPIHFRPHWRETSAQFKVRMMAELGPVAHFEDDPFTAAWVAEIVPHVFLVDWPRNRWLEGPNIHRIGRLGEASLLLRPLPPDPQAL
jgi:hypothetical protein